VTSSEVQTTRASTGSAQAWVIDTNILLDLWLFEDPATVPLRAALQSGLIAHLATASMRDELERVLTYPHIV
jgi:predicted nucleic acid-binding protein